MPSDKRCCVPGCKESGRTQTVLHGFPNPDKDRPRFNTWLNSIGGDILALEIAHVYKYRRVCHKHFQDQYLCRNRRISKVAVPTLYLPEPQEIINNDVPEVASDHVPEVTSDHVPESDMSGSNITREYIVTWECEEVKAEMLEEEVILESVNNSNKSDTDDYFNNEPQTSSTSISINEAKTAIATVRSFIEQCSNIDENVFDSLFVIENRIDLETELA